MGINVLKPVKRLRISNTTLDAQTWIAYDPDEDGPVIEGLTHKGKVIVFSFPGALPPGPKHPIIRFPYKGIIKNVYALLMNPGDSDVLFQIEKCTNEEFDSTQNWSDLLSTPAIVDGLEASSATASQLPTIINTHVDVYDHFRVNIIDGGTNATNMTVEVDIEVV